MPLEAAPAQPPPVAQPSAPAAPAAAAPVAEKQHEGVPELMKLLMQDVTAEDRGETEEKKEEKKPEPAAAPAAAAPAAPAALEEKPVRVRKPKVERPALPIEEKKPAPVAAALAAPVAPVVDQETFEKGLEENEREMLDDARELEKATGDKHKGIAARTEKFIRDNIAWTQRADFDDQDPEYLKFLETNQPKLSRSDIRLIETARISAGLRKEYDGKFGDLQHQTFVRDNESKIEQVGQSAYAELTNSALPDDVKAELLTQIKAHGPQKGYEEAMKTFKMEIETAEEILVAAADDLKEFTRLNTKNPETGRTMVEFAVDPKNPKFAQHQRIVSMIGDICEEFKNTAGENAVRAGKWFVTREEWHKIRPDQRNRFWTFTNAEISQIAKTKIKPVIAQAIEQKTKFLADRGWKRSTASAAPAAAPAPERSSPPPPAPSPVPGAGAQPGGGVSAETAKLATHLAAG